MPGPSQNVPQNAPTRVVILLQDLKFGGTQRQALELVSRLDKLRFGAEIWLMASGDDLSAAAQDMNVHMVRLSRLPYVGLISLLRLWHRLRTQKTDLLLPMTVVPNIWGRLVGRMSTVPIVVGTCRGSGSPVRQHERWLWHAADHLVCNCTALKRLLTGECRVPDHRITVIPNGVDLEFFSPQEGSTVDKAVVTCVARLVSDKDHETLISAFQQVRRTHGAAELWLVGDGPGYGRILKQSAQLLPSGSVRMFPGRKDIRPLLRQSSLLVLNSIQEGLPNVVLEAMATGLPVVATDVGGISEAVIDGRTGLLVPRKDSSSLAAAIARLLSDEHIRVGYGREGRSRAERYYGVSSMVRKHEALFSSLLMASAQDVFR